MKYVTALATLAAVSTASAFICPTGGDWMATLADMHDGDEKAIVIDGNAMTITPHGSNETWVIETTVDDNSCSAIVDFNVPGKPGPPPVPLLASFVSTTLATDEFQCNDAESCAYYVKFTDPSGTLVDSTTYPLNVWVSL